jgi:hypothetical protein
MNLKAVAAAAAILAAGAPALASAQTTAPVAVTGSSIFAENAGASIYQPGEVDFQFVNNRYVAATQVDFALSSGGQQLGVYHAYGTFSPGVKIDKVFRTDEVAPHQQISVASVKFADGTTWTNDTVAPQARRQADDVSLLDQ